jgi:hypothetical protein
MSVLACLSPQKILLSIEISGYAAAFAIGITMTSVFLSWHQRTYRWLPVCLLLLLIHPAWAISAYGGDCGDYKRFMSEVISIVFVAVIVCQIFFSKLSRLRFLFGVCIALWTLIIPAIVGQVIHYYFHSDNEFAQSVIESYSLSAPRIFVITIALSLLWFVFWLFERIRLWTHSDTRSKE